MEDRRRKELIDRMLGATSREEVEAADDDAERWLSARPYDMQVVAARERLDKTSAKLGEPKRRVKQLGWVAFVVVFAAMTLLIGTYTGRWGLGVVSALALAEGAAYVVWLVGGAGGE